MVSRLGRYSAIALVAGCVGGTPKDDSGADEGPAAGRWVGVCTAVVSGGGQQTGAVPVTSTTTTTTSTTPTSTPTTTPGGTGSAFYYYSGGYEYYYYYTGGGYTYTTTILLDPAILTLSDDGGTLDGTFGYSIEGDSYPPWVVAGTRTGTDVHLDVTGALQTGTTVSSTYDIPVHFELVLDGDTMAGNLVVDYSQYYSSYDVATSSTTAGAPFYSGSSYYYCSTGGYVPETVYIPCNFTRE